ncbi:thioredoxin family protein [Streptomyces sp. NEAU-H22]|uniref:TlpA family protein disulfide reductase n=1 Tax=unclassified Streptomyces TaxID=2593676 RepID=UPI00225A69D7|nr:MULTISPECIES: thioredoxin family protein [unclassified Streptomyces]MCX3290321.1 thioredoxin family protein [Streptomyces sp. NEAU-H22]WMD10135.1 thioredoxin family protein [Streptomyces sp. FXY-T5]
MTGLVVCVVVLATASAYGVLQRRRSGRVRVRGRDDGKRLDAADLGAELGERATLVQFSSAFCAPCRATRRVLGEVAAVVPGVTHVEIDAEAHLDLVRRLDILKTPTVLVLDADGRVVRRAAGQPRKADVIAALGEAV